MRTCTIVVLAAALALGACKKEDKGAATDKKETPAAKAGGGEMKEDKAAPTPAKDEPAPAKDEPAPTAPPAAGGDSITLTPAPHAVGDKWTEDSVQEMELTISAQGQQIPMVGGEHEVKSIEVLGVTDGVVTKAKYTYTTMEKSQKLGGKEQAKPSSIAGKTYTLEAGKPLVVTTDAGPAPEAEAKEVADAEKNFGEVDKMDKLLQGKTFVKDQAMDLPAAEIAQAMGDDPSMVVKKLTMTYRGMDGDHALFDMAMVMEQTTPGGKLDMDMTGKAMVDPKTNELVEMSLEGKMHMTGQATAEGTMKMQKKRLP
jgi:hypothetical protein